VKKLRSLLARISPVPSAFDIRREAGIGIVKWLHAWSTALTPPPLPDSSSAPVVIRGSNVTQCCARGDMENRIKDKEMGLFADRTSSIQWLSNQWRLVLPDFAYTVFKRLR